MQSNSSRFAVLVLGIIAIVTCGMIVVTPIDLRFYQLDSVRVPSACSRQVGALLHSARLAIDGIHVLRVFAPHHTWTPTWPENLIELNPCTPRANLWLRRHATDRALVSATVDTTGRVEPLSLVEVGGVLGQHRVEARRLVEALRLIPPTVHTRRVRVEITVLVLFP